MWCYFQVIKTPIDLSTIRTNLEHGMYKDWSAFTSAMSVMFNNCRAYNHPSLAVSRCASAVVLASHVWGACLFADDVVYLKPATLQYCGGNIWHHPPPLISLGRALEKIFQLELDKLDGTKLTVNGEASQRGLVNQVLSLPQQPSATKRGEQDSIGNGIIANVGLKSKFKTKKKKAVTAGAAQLDAKRAGPGPIRKLFEDYAASRKSTNAAKAHSQAVSAPSQHQSGSQDRDAGPRDTIAPASKRRKTSQSPGKEPPSDQLAASQYRTIAETSEASKPLPSAAANEVNSNTQAHMETAAQLPGPAPSVPHAAIDTEGEEMDEEDSRLLDKPPRSTEAQKQARRVKRAEQLRCAPLRMFPPANLDS